MGSLNLNIFLVFVNIVVGMINIVNQDWSMAFLNSSLIFVCMVSAATVAITDAIKRR